MGCQKQSKQTYGIRRVRLWIQRTNRDELVNTQGDPAGHAQAESSVGHSSPQALYPLPAGRSQISQSPAIGAFDQAKPNQFWVTDITYIPISGNMLYMCAVLDLCGKVVLAWKIGADMTSSLVTDTIREALQTEKVTGGLALHSDQGSQYTSQAYFDLAQAYHVSAFDVQSWLPL